jgi:glycosyltransferase involved in cell wall biosynthesis
MTAISVIIPASNQAHYRAEAIESVLAQSFQNFEIIIIDDGSTDHTRQVAASFLTDSRVHYIYQQNAGLSAARNTGMAQAAGEFVTFLDSDDRFLPDKFAVLLACFKARPELGLVSGQAIFIDADSRRLPHTVDGRWTHIPADLLLGNPVHVGSLLVRREWLAQVDPFDESLRACEDWDMWLRLALAGCQFDHAAQPVSLYRIHGDQMTREAERMRIASLTVLDKIMAMPNLPDAWQSKKDAAYAAAYVRAAARFYHAAAFDRARYDLAEAVRLNPTLLDDGAGVVWNQLVGWANAPMCADPLGYLERVYANLPDALDSLRRRRRANLGDTAANLAFEAYQQGNRSQTRSLMWRAFYYQPSLLTNRGALSALAQSWLPDSQQTN